jgi:hypothetical protein
MRGIITAIILVLGIGLADTSRAQVTCQKVGAQTYCSNGQVMQRFGNTTYDGKGHAWQETGNNTRNNTRNNTSNTTTTGSNGTIYQQSPNQISDNKGAVFQQFGNQTVGSNGSVYLNSGSGANVSQQFTNFKSWGTGSSCYPVGDQVFCDPAPAQKNQQTAKGPGPEAPITGSPNGPLPEPGPLDPKIEQFGP